MTEHETEVFFTDISELLDIFNQYSPVQTNGTFVTESVKPEEPAKTPYTKATFASVYSDMLKNK